MIANLLAQAPTFVTRKPASVFVIIISVDVRANAASMASTTSPPAHVSIINMRFVTKGKTNFLRS